MAKKKNGRIKAPPLSKLDKGIYYCLIACSLAAALLLYPAIIGCFRRSVFENVHILAQTNPSIVILGFFGMFLGGGFALAFDWLRRKRQPIFGKSNFKYGPPHWKRGVYPLFSKQFWTMLYSNKKLLKIVVFISFLLSFVVTAATILVLPMRDCLYDDGSISVYGCLNQSTAQYSKEDVAEIQIDTCTHYSRGRDPWGIEIEILMNDGEEFFFSDGDFQTLDDNIRGSISGMYQIKSCFDPNIITIGGKDDIPYVIRDMKLNQQETELLYLLFDMSESLATE